MHSYDNHNIKLSYNKCNIYIHYLAIILDYEIILDFCCYGMQIKILVAMVI